MLPGESAYLEDRRRTTRGGRRGPGGKLLVPARSGRRGAAGGDAIRGDVKGACINIARDLGETDRWSTDDSDDAISNGGTTVLTITRADFEMLLDFNRELAHKVLWAVTRLLSGRLRNTNDSLRSFLAMSMF